MNNTALQLRQADTMAEWQTMRQQAETLVKTGFLPGSIKTPDQAVAIVLMGREIGVGMMVALNNINVIAGKPTISPQLMLALINRTGELEDIRIDDDGQCCSVAMRRKGRSVHSEAFSMKDAALMKTTEGYGENKKTIPLADKYNWRQMPAVMRKWRAIAACARVVFPDVILGMYTPDEMGAAVEPESGEVIEMPRDDDPVIIVKPKPEPEKAPAPVQQPSGNDAPSVTATEFWKSVRKWKVPEKESSDYAQAAIEGEITWAEALNTLREMYG